MSFKKYSSIENSYRQKYILKCIQEFPDLQNEEFIATEKLDGANIQFYFRPNQPYLVGKRSSYIEEGDGFFDIWSVIPKYEKELNIIQNEVNSTGVELRIYGELFGPGINGRVNYGEERQILFFDAQMNDVWLSPASFDMILVGLSLQHMKVPVIGIYKNLNEALEINENFNSKILSIDNNHSEGIVIQPYRKVFLRQDSRFILKKKSDNFREKENKAAKPNSKQEMYPPEVINAMIEFKTYLNRNRLLGIFSKHGEIKEPKQMGEYIKLMIEDAKEDFLKDNDIKIDKDIEKVVFNKSGGLVARLLQEFL